jgi:hypothetical protein
MKMATKEKMDSLGKQVHEPREIIFAHGSFTNNFTDRYMGSIIKAQCKCGYEHEMHLGGGMLNFTTNCNFPVFCSKCRSLFEANILDKNLTCPKCHDSDIIPYYDKSLCSEKGNEVFSWNMQEEIGRELILTDGKYLCPNCGQFSMSFVACGHWD